MSESFMLSDPPELPLGTFCVYEIFHRTTKKSYYGVTSNLKRRMMSHIKGRTDSTKSHIHNAIVSCGHESFCVRIVQIFSNKNDAYDLETRLIQENSTIETGYNIAAGGKGYRNISDSSMEKLRNLIWVTDGSADMRVDMSAPIPEGWWRGRKKRGSKLVAVHKDGVCVKIEQNRIAEYIENGWERGNGQKRDRTLKIRNGDSRKVVSLEEFNTIYEPAGWVRGWGIQHAKDRSIMVSPEGKRMYVDNSEIDYYENLGWYSVRKRKESEITKRKIYAIETPLGVLVGNITELSNQLGIDRSTLRYRLKKGVHREVSLP